MNPRLWVLICGLSLALALLLAATADTKSDATEAARMNNLGCAYMNQQLFEKALKAFEQAAALDSALRVAKLNQGIALLNLARVDPARKVLEEAAQADPRDPHVWYALGMLDKNSSNPQAAVQEFRRVTEIDDTDADTWYFLGSVYSQLKQFPEAIDAFEHALRLNRLHASAQFGLSRAFQQSGDSAHAREHLARFQYVTQHKLGSAMSLAYGEQGKYSLAEESSAAAGRVPAQIAVKFINVTDEAGLRDTTAKASAANNVPPQAASGLGPGACFTDYDNDGKIDMLLPGSRSDGALSLYHNLGSGKFEDVTNKAGLDRYTGVLSCTAGDYDNDGFPDLALAFRGGIALLHNEKNGTFKDVTSEAGITAEAGATGLTFIDYDHDGDLDLYVSRLGTGEAKVPDIEGSMWRNNGNATFTNVTDETGLTGFPPAVGAIGTDYNNDRAVDLAVAAFPPRLYRNPREGKFELLSPSGADQNIPTADGNSAAPGLAIVAADFDHDGWMDLVATGTGGPQLWRNDHGKNFEKKALPETSWKTSYGAAAFDYDNDGWVDLVVLGETKDGKGEVRLFRNLGPDGFKDVSAEVGLDRIQLKDPRAVITGDFDNDGATDLLITRRTGLPILLKNQGGNKNSWLRLALKGLNDNKSAIGTKVEVFSDGIRQKFELYGSNGYLGQNSPYLTVGLGQAKQADVVRMLWPGGVLQDEIEVAGERQQDFLELDRRGSSCPTLFAWNGKNFELVADILGAGVIGHWMGPGQRNIPRPTEWLRVDGHTIQQRRAEVLPLTGAKTADSVLSFRLLEPMEEVVYLDAVKLLAIDHPEAEQVYPNEYFATGPPYPEFKVITSRDAHPPAGAWDEIGDDLLPDLLAHKYVGRFDLLPFKGFTKPHNLILDLGEPYGGGPLRLLLHGEIEYFTATGMYAASQAGIAATAPYIEAEVPKGASGGTRWVRVADDMGFPAGLPRTITVDLSARIPRGSRRIRITTNLEIYWDNILIDHSKPGGDFRLSNVPLSRATLEYHGYSRQIEDQPPGNVKYVYDQVSGTGPYARQAGLYTRYGDVLPLLGAFDDRLVVFGSGEEVALEFSPAKLPAVPRGWTRDYFFLANGYEKDMDFYAARGDTVEPLPFSHMGTYPSAERFPSDRQHLDYLLEYNTRYVSGNEPRGYAFAYRTIDGEK
ncbi:MAG: VCBS repeat-containing protein [Acidobacteria bacterium]|nr:VCBS repeat-containing protein [Acidobacteriota bacterium]